MKVNFRRVDAVLRQEFRDADVVPVLFAFEVILHQDHRVIRARTHPVESPVRSAFFNRRDFDLLFLEAREMEPRLPEEQIGPSRGILDVDVTQRAFSLLVGADDTVPQVAS